MSRSNVQFIVSGQPKMGHESWPSSVDDKVLSDRLYSQRGAEEETRMEVKFEKIGDRYVTYYHFSKLKNITSCLTDDDKKFAKDHGRPGSFFVMSLRLDNVYSTNFTGIYEKLESLYEHYVEENILKRSKEGFLVYQVMKLEEAKSTWEQIYNELTVQSINILLNKTKHIPNSIIIKGVKVPEYFCVGEDDNAEEALLREGQIVFLSRKEQALREERLVKDKQSTTDESLIENIAENIKRNEVNNLGLEKEHSSITYNATIQEGKDEKLYDIDEDLDKSSPTLGNGLAIPRKKDNFGRLAIVFLLGCCCGSGISFMISHTEGVSQASPIGHDTIYIEKEQQAIKTSHIESDTITLLDLRKADADMSNATEMQKGNNYIVVAKTGTSNKRQNANGSGKFLCDVGRNEVILEQKGAECHITVLEDANVKKIQLVYVYELKKGYTFYFREIKIK
ncbi:MAG: hypothetical protein J1E57_05210 [Prevotella sp.]|nr:hypothetical protein [Prevotella sp.]